MTMAESMRVNGKTTKDKEMVPKSLRLEVNMSASIKITNLMARVYLLGTVERPTKESGNLVERMVLEYGKGLITILMLGIGKIIRLVGMVCINGVMGTSTMVNGRIQLNMDREQNSSQMETPTQVYIIMVNLTVMDNINGEKELCM
jgi:hypothetical protein